MSDKPENVAQKEKITIRVNPVLMQRLREQYDYFENDSELIRFALSFLELTARNS